MGNDFRPQGFYIFAYRGDEHICLDRYFLAQGSERDEDYFAL
jgi:hypothetical protein